MLQAAAAGPVGSVSRANGSVFKTGATGLDNVGAGAAINVGDVIATGASSSATVSLGGGCNLALGPSAQVSVTPVDGGLCVRMIEEPVGGFGGDGGGVLLAGAGALTVGGGLLIGLGLSNPASN